MSEYSQPTTGSAGVRARRSRAAPVPSRVPGSSRRPAGKPGRIGPRACRQPGAMGAWAGIVLGLIALGWSVAATPEPGAGREPASELAGAFGIVETCGACHDLAGPGYALDPHGVLNRDPELAAHRGVASSCNACHGDTERHLEEGGSVDSVFSFSDDLPALVRNESCVGCHADSHPRFLASTHAQAGLACVDCHSIHGAQSPAFDDVALHSGAAAARPATLEPARAADPGRRGLLALPAGALARDLARRIGVASASCAQCHGAVLAEFGSNERHRLREGVVSCIDCHDPHEPAGRLRLGGFGNAACASCHADKDGPFVFEHGAQRVEGCVACHTPHGSPNRHMLRTQSVADLCYSCHAAVPGFHTRFGSETVCTNCHVTIHGSNFQPGFLK